jgi:uncharacterized protein
MGYLTAIVQATDGCNLRCKYCYVGETIRRDMSKETLRNLIFKMRDYAGDKHVSIIWHGGEPLLRGINFYKYANSVVKESGKKMEMNMQTNGTLITDNVADFLAGSGMSVGVSLDGPEKIHDANRVYPSEIGSFNGVMKGIDNLRKRTKRASAIAVFTRHSLRNLREFYDFFNNERIDIKVNPIDLAGRATIDQENLVLKPEEFGGAMNDLFDMWFYDSNAKIEISNFMDAMKSASFGHHFGCLYSGDSCGKSYISVSPNGDVYPCSRFTSEAKFKLGNINNETIEEMFQKPVFMDFGARRASLEGCNDCEFKKICNGGCTSRAYSFHGTINKPDYYCKSTQMLFAHIRDVLDQEAERRLKK